MVSCHLGRRRAHASDGLVYDVGQVTVHQMRSGRATLASLLRCYAIAAAFAVTGSSAMQRIEMYISDPPCLRPRSEVSTVLSLADVDEANGMSHWTLADVRANNQAAGAPR